MTRTQYVQFARRILDEQGLKDWKVKLSTNDRAHFLGLCSYKDKAIILNAFHLDTHPEPECINTILHEVAHALSPGMGHNFIWEKKARELGCDNTLPCATYTLSADAIDAIRSGATLEIEYTEQVIRTPTFRVTRIQDMCPECGKVAKEKSTFQYVDKDGSDVRITVLECLHIIRKVLPKGTPFETMVSNSHEERVKTCVHKWDKNKCEKCGEFKLFDFQIAGAKFVENALAYKKGALIADEMGLGKTVQSLAVLKFHPELFPALFVVKSGLKFQWSSEILRWLGPEYIAQVIETGQHYIFPGFKSYIISYDLIRRLDPKVKAKLDALGIKTIILDEVQQIKNPDSTRTAGVRLLAKPPEVKVIELSGTPWKNRGSEFFPALNLLDPIKFHSYVYYCDNWVDYYFEGARRKEGGINRPKEFKEYVKDIVIRRERTEVMKELPIVSRTKLNVQLDEFEQESYDEATSNFVKWYNDYIMSGEEDKIDSLELIAKMQKMRHIVGLAKIPATLGFIEEFVDSEDDKMVVFVHHIDVGDIIESELKKKYKDRPILRLRGGMDPLRRYEIQEEFNKSKNALMVASTLGAGEGLNLQTGHVCIMHERQWNPGNEEQAEGRFIRIGQTSDHVDATYVEGFDTIDMHFDGIVEHKRRFFHDAMNNGEAPVWNETDIMKELAQKIVENYNKKKAKKGPKLGDKVKVKV